MENTSYRKYFEASSLIIILYINGGVSQLLCPNVGEINSTVILKYTFTIRSDQTYSNPDGDVAAVCSTKTTMCGNNPGYKGTVVNMTHSYLEISKVMLADAGNWTLQDGMVNTSCTMVVTKTPSCNITSYRDTSELYVEDEMTLSVDIQNYYCSRSLKMLLVTGKITGHLIDNTTVKSIQSKTVNSTFMLTDSHFGSVEVDFVCNNVSKKVPCQGENILVKQNFACTITAGDTDTDDEVSLTVDIREYKCSQPTEFMLITGSTTLELNETHDSAIFTTRFTLTNHHLGPVNLIFLCNNVSRRFTCDGVKTLPINHPETTQAPTSDIPGSMKVTNDRMIAIIAGAAAAAVFVIVIVIIVVCVVKKRRKSALKDKYRSAAGADSFNTKSKSIRMTAPGAYEDIGDVSSAFGNNAYEKDAAGSKTDVEMVINEGYMSCDDVKISGPRSCDSLQPETQSTFRPKNDYTQIDAKPKVQC